MAATVYDYYRLYLLTADAHFLRFARFLQDATKQLLDWDGSLGYSFPGLLAEAMHLTPKRGYGVRVWLPWLTVAVLEPLEQMRTAFGTLDIDRAQQLSQEERFKGFFPGLSASPPPPRTSTSASSTADSTDVMADGGLRSSADLPLYMAVALFFRDH